MALPGDLVSLRPATHADVDELARIRSQHEVRQWWRGSDLENEITSDIDDPELHLFVIEDGNGAVVGGIQFHEENDPDYRHAGIDVFVATEFHGQGLGTDAIRIMVRHLTTALGHHRLTIDPAADNAAAIRTYEKAGFRPVGIMRRYERGLDGDWHDGLLMDLLAEDVSPRPARATPLR